MDIEATWSRPIELTDGVKIGLIYSLPIEEIPAESGVYIFARTHGAKVFPLYIGESQNLRARLRQHLEKVPLMKAIEGALTGKKVVLYCTLSTNSKDRSKKQLKIVEKALILHAQSEGHELFNKKGTKLPTDTISFTGNCTSESIAPRLMRIEHALTRRPTRTASKLGKH